MSSGGGLRGSSFWMHEDLTYRPREVYDNEVTIYGGGDRASYLLVPVIPPA